MIPDCCGVLMTKVYTENFKEVAQPTDNANDPDSVDIQKTD